MVDSDEEAADACSSWAPSSRLSPWALGVPVERSVGHNVDMQMDDIERQMVAEFRPKPRSVPAAYSIDLNMDADVRKFDAAVQRQRQNKKCPPKRAAIGGQVDLRSIIIKRRSEKPPARVVLASAENLLRVQVQVKEQERRCEVTSSTKPEPGPLPRHRSTSTSSVEEVAVEPKRVVVLDTIDLSSDSEPESKPPRRDTNKLPVTGVGITGAEVPGTAAAAAFSPAAALAAAEGFSPATVPATPAPAATPAAASASAHPDDYWRPWGVKEERAEPAQRRPALLPTPSQLCPSYEAAWGVQRPQPPSSCRPTVRASGPSGPTGERCGWCKSCNQLFYSWAEFINHHHRWHKVFNALVCNRCGLDVGEGERESHDRLHCHSEAVRSACKFCPARFTEVKHLMTHVVAYHRVLSVELDWLKKSLQS